LLLKKPFRNEIIDFYVQLANKNKAPQGYTHVQENFQERNSSRVEPLQITGREIKMQINERLACALVHSFTLTSIIILDAAATVCLNYCVREMGYTSTHTYKAQTFFNLLWMHSLLGSLALSF